MLSIIVESRSRMSDCALSGVRVVDISQGIAGPYATKLLADWLKKLARDS